MAKSQAEPRFHRALKFLYLILQCSGENSPDRPGRYGFIPMNLKRVSIVRKDEETN